MALDAKGQSIHCDGEGCEAETPVPVALRRTLDSGTRKSEAAQGWLFVVSGDGCLHFCPHCAQQVQNLYTENVGLPLQSKRLLLMEG